MSQTAALMGACLARIFGRMGVCALNSGEGEFTPVMIQGMHYSKESHKVLNNLILVMKKLFYGDSQPVGPNPLWRRVR